MVNVRADCIYEKMTCPVKVIRVPCGKPHHKLLHNSKKPVILNLAQTSAPDGDNILASIVQVKFKTDGFHCHIDCLKYIKQNLIRSGGR